MSKCAFCHRKASYKQEHRVGNKIKITYYCEGHKKEGCAFGFLEENELKKI